jgi:prolyl-tRNA synthetase
LIEGVPGILDNIQNSLLEQALKFRQQNTHEVENYDEFKSILESKRGFIRTFWCGKQECEDRIKEETMGTIRIIPLEQNKQGKCVCCGSESDQWVYFARAY